MADRRARAAVFEETRFLTENEVRTHAKIGDRFVNGLLHTRPFYRMKPLPPAAVAVANDTDADTNADVALLTAPSLPPPVVVWETDTVTATFDVVRAAGVDKRVCVLNMASERVPGGGVKSGANAQEECLCRCSSLYASLTRDRRFYPLPDEGGLYSPDVCFFRAADHTVKAWDDCVFADVVSVAAIRRPELVKDGLDVDDWALTDTKIRGLLRVCAQRGAAILVLGALGCGAFKNPPHDIAALFRDTLLDREFHGRFERVVFAIIDNDHTQNFKTFSGMLRPLAPRSPLSVSMI